uniref:non-specific serine/threonine protein kinase n=1 Tax=Vitis vinifera TaxID=29760 RepID=F6H520_VITVI
MLRVSCPFRDHHTGILVTNWSTKSSYCTWYGISCNAPQQRVSAINLSNMGLEGTIAPQVGNLSFLISLDLSNNYFHAFLPKEIGKCKELQQLNLFNNNLVGSIPEAICNLSKLEELYLGNNKLAGEIPKKMSDLLNLKILSFPMNNLTGSIPATIFNISSLLNISLSYNSLSGNLPMVMCNTNPKLKELNLSSNHLSGEIPTSLSQCIKLQVISLSYNEFTGSIPKGIGNLVELQRLSFRNNNLIGEIPQSLFNISSLRFLNLAANQLEGEIPSNLSHCRELRVLSLSLNQFTGGIPQAIGSLSNLEELYLGYNNLGGGIPSEIGNLHNLNILNFESARLSGPIPAQIFNISSLQVIAFSNNSLSGSLPIDICKHLPNLQRLHLSWNQLSGQLPTTLSLCGELLSLSLYYNKYAGSIIREIGNLSKLEQIYLGRNNFTSTIPPSFGNLTAIQELGLEENNFQGNIPKELGKLINLQILHLGQNNLTGIVPEAIINISKLQVLSLSLNHLSGSLPSSIGTWLPNLEGLYIGANEFSGKIPMSISNMSKLLFMDISNNYFIGNLPKDLGNMRRLQILNLSYNQLTNEQSDSELAFFTSLTNCISLRKLRIGGNPLKGIIPNSLGNLSISIERIGARSCQLRGTIPTGVSNLTNLIGLGLDDNDLTGLIPTSFGRLQKLQALGISQNRIRGSIPSDLCHLTNLGFLDLSSNKLSGTIPSCFGNLTSLRRINLHSNGLASEIPSSLWILRYLLFLNLSSNFLNGELPLEVGNMKSLEELDLSKNQFSGNIPSTISLLQNLLQLYLSHNKLQGHIPPNFDDLVSLEYLDLSGNNLSGFIPKSLEALKYLKYLNVSFNKLQGEIPNGGPFANFTAESFISNLALCGAPRFQVMACEKDTRRNTKSLLLKCIVPLSVSLSTIILVVLFVLWKRRQTKSETPVQVDLLLPRMHRMILHQELLYATSYFGEDNLIGKGSLGTVYKGVLSDGLIVAVKVFNLELQGAFKSFEVECEVMQNIRHRNLAKIISSCSNLDFKALVLEYMPNGSLEKWLYSHNYYLDFVQRLKIMIDVASGLEYLHHDYSSPVVHCDLKPNNVLLDDDMVAHISDFGIAKLLMGSEFMKRTKTLGTIGYMAPEYGSEGIVSTKCDIYSFGIMLMETFVRKKPTDEMFMEELTLKSWVESSTNNIMEVIDANLLTEEDESFALKQACFSSIMTLALNCTAEPPEKRINMKDTLRSLTALTGLTGVTAAVCCYTSEVVALLKLGGLLHFVRLVTQWKILRHRSGYRICKILVRWIKSFQSRLNAFAPLSWTAPSYCLFLNTLCLINFSGFFLGFGRTALSLDPRLALLSFWKTAPQLSLLDRLNPLLQERLRVSSLFYFLTHFFQEVCYPPITLPSLTLVLLNHILSFNIYQRLFFLVLVRLIFGNNQRYYQPLLQKCQYALIFNISSLLNISLSYKSLSGSLPMNICNTNPKLKELNLSSNHLSGQIPIGLGQCIKLQVISLSYNEFTGSIPRGIGELVELQRFSPE